MNPQLLLRLLWPVFLILFSFSFFVNLLSMTLPLYMMQVFDRVLTSRSTDTLWALSAIAFFMIACYGLLDGVRSRILLGVDEWIDAKLFTPLVKTRLARSAEGRLDANRGGLSDLRNFRQFFSGSTVLSVLDTIWSPMFLVVGLLIHPILGFIGLIGAAGLAGLSVANEYVMRTPQQFANILTRRTQDQLESAARSAEVVTALGMGPAIGARIEASAKEARDLGQRANKRANIVAGAAKVFRYLVQMAIMGVGIWLVLSQNLAPGAVFAASMIIGRGLAPFEQMQRTWSIVVSARQAYRQLQEYLGAPTAETSSVSFPRPNGALSVENVYYVPPGAQRPVLQGISFSLSPGEALGIVGPSAAGKSTLARLLIGVWHPRSGRIRLDGVDVAFWDPVDFGPHVGYLPQDVELLTGSVRENIARFSEADDDDVINAAKLANAHDLIVRLPKGYDTDVGESGALLSGGQRQRIALARALFGDPHYIVLDEPNSNLDSEGETAMLEALQAAKARGATIIIVAHRPSLLTFVDKLLVLKAGTVEMFGDRQAVMAKLQPRPAVVARLADTAATS
jgi:PrtD family type I secretion system ABC transporter